MYHKLHLNDSNRPQLVVINNNTENSIRGQKLTNEFIEKNFGSCQDEKNDQDYFQALSQTKFVLSPPGQTITQTLPPMY